MPSCPFNSKAYLSSLAHLGSVEIRAGAPFPVLKRPIEGTECRDGLGAWPYVLVEHDEQLEALTEAFSDLVTLTLVTQPGFRPLCQKSNAIRFKEHYVFDPARPYPTLGRRTREHLRRAAKSFDFDTTTTRAEALKIIPLYAELKRRRGLAGGFFDFPNAHFEAVASLNAAIFFRVNGPRGAAAMACGIVLDPASTHRHCRRGTSRGCGLSLDAGHAGLRKGGRAAARHGRDTASRRCGHGPFQGTVVEPDRARLSVALRQRRRPLCRARAGTRDAGLFPGLSLAVDRVPALYGGRHQRGSRRSRDG